jgi:thioredoxin reductase (NADPH)
VVEQEVPGGQASYSALVENYPGFPEGLSGSELARRTIQQAERFGVEVLVTRRATGLQGEGCRRVTLDEGTELASHAVLLALGVSFRWLEAPGCPPARGRRGVLRRGDRGGCGLRDQVVYVLGGGNSAGQAALLLAQFARRVVILALEPTLEETMSRYLIDRIRSSGNIVVRTGCTVVAVEGDDHLEGLTIGDVRTGRTEQVRAQGLFIFIGATPRTDWLPDDVARDDRGFVLAGADLTCNGRGGGVWPLTREPYPLETSLPGVFVAGDVRRGSVKRMASAAGEGSAAIQFIYRYLRARSGA